MGDRAHLWNTKAQLQALQHLVSTLPGPDEPPVKREPTPKQRTARQIKGKQAEALAQAYEAGATIYELAERFGVTRQTVGRILKRQGVKIRWLRLTEEGLDEAERVYAQGLSLVRVAERLNVSADTVRLRLRKRGVQMRDPHERS